MTSEHCGHECVCNLYLNECWYGHLLADKSLPCDMKGVLTKPCEHDTRTHSAAEPVPEKCEYPEDCRRPADCPETSLARWQEREKVLDEIFGYISTKGVEKRPEGYYVVFGTFSLADMLEYLESLRQQEEP
jgi:hypothetical protein